MVVVTGNVVVSAAASTGVVRVVTADSPGVSSRVHAAVTEHSPTSNASGRRSDRRGAAEHVTVSPTLLLRPRSPASPNRPIRSAATLTLVDRRLALTAVVGMLVALLFAIVATADQEPLAQRSPSLPFALPEADFSQLETPVTSPPAGEIDQRRPTEPSPGWDLLISLVQYAFTGAAIALAAWVAFKAWQHRPRLAWRRRTPRPDFVPLDDIAAAVVADAAAQIATLREGQARNAIVRCWSRLEHLVVDAGTPPQPSDTPLEFTERVLRTYAVDGVALDQLAMLYREARFSTHRMDEIHRAAAIDALERLHVDLIPRSEAASPS